MASNEDWDIDKYRDEYESDEHWNLRKLFMERWKHNYTEERLVCLARVFANIELMGCRYPNEVMQEVAGLSREVAQSYRKCRKNKLQRTFVSASDAAEDRAKGVKREGGIIIDTPTHKSARISFVRQGQGIPSDNISKNKPDSDDSTDANIISNSIKETEDKTLPKVDAEGYLNDMLQVPCLDVRSFREDMFQSEFGRLVLLIRPWASKLCNIQSSCLSCKSTATVTYENRLCSLHINNRLVAQASGDVKAEARSIVEAMAWDRLRSSVVSVIVKERWSAQNDERISARQVTGAGAGAGAGDAFGTRVETGVASKMMKMMGWKGGGLGADAQGIEEPIKPNLQMVNRAGLGSAPNIQQLRRAAAALMNRYLSSDSLDVELVFSSEFSSEERALLHQCARRAGLASQSYGQTDRFLVVKKKLDPFSLARAVIEKGGNTPKYQVFIPVALDTKNGR